MKYKIILASNSPRRKELLAGLDFPFEVRVMQGIDESFPDTLNAYDTALYIARKKADAYQSLLEEGDDNLLVLTADTVVIAPSDGFLNDQECKGEKEKSLSDYVISDSNGEPLSDSQFCRLWHYITARRVKERKIYRYISMARKSITPFLLSLVRDVERTRASTILWISM